jgi:RNA polymerase sigma factor (sigma-70 family)
MRNVKHRRTDVALGSGQLRRSGRIPRSAPGKVRLLEASFPGANTVALAGMTEDRFLATRRTLLHRLRNLDDHAGWREFFEIYWRLIYAVARRSGLDEFEAEEVVQETVITAARKIPEFRYDPAVGSFRGWLLTIARWRIADQFRKRQIEEPATIEQIAELAETTFDNIWTEEWEKHLLDAALEILKRRVSPEQFQLFECYVIKRWPAPKVAEVLGVRTNLVYLAKNRLSPMLREIVARIEKGEYQLGSARDSGS